MSRRQWPTVLVFSFLLAGPRLLCIRADGQAPQTQAHGGSSAGALSVQDSTLKNKALEDYDAGRLAEALPVLLKLTERYPAQADLQASTGMCLLESGQLETGAAHLEIAHRLLPGNNEITQNLGIAYLKLHHAQKAVALLQLAVTHAPRSYEARLALAQAQREAGQSEPAAASFSQASRMQSPPAPELLCDWAETLLAAGKPERAAEVIRRVPPSSADASVEELKGEIEEKAGHPEAAIASFRHAAELNPTAVNVQAYGEELLRHWTFAPAATIFQYGVDRYPANTHLRMDLGIAFFGNNDFARSSEVFSALLAQEPENNMAADLLGRSCSAAAAAAPPACDGLAAFARKHPGNASASLYAAVSLLQRPEDPEAAKQAEALLRQALVANPKLPEAWYQLGALQQGREDWASSEESLRHAIALRPAYSEAHYRLSRAYAHTGRTADARTELALQRESATAAKTEEQKRMEGVLTFLTTPN